MAFFKASGVRRVLAAALAVCGLLLLALGTAGCGSGGAPRPADTADSPETQPRPIRISEACCANFTLWPDPETGEFSDYVELVNAGSESADTAGCFLSDQSRKPELFALPSVILEPGETLVLIADGAGTSGLAQEGAIHLNFSLKPGETLYLRAPDGALLDSVTLPERHKNISMTALDGAWVQAEGTPGRSNEGARIYTPATLAAPELSLPSGFYAEPQTLSITAPAGCEIRYTLDGSLPTSESPLYTGPLTLEDVSSRPNRVVSQPNTTADRSGAVLEPVPKGTLLRAAAFDGALGRSETVTAVYFVGDFSAFAGRSILNVTADPYDLFGTYGIAVTGPDYDAWLEAGGEGAAPLPNYKKRGRVWERDAELLLWDADGTAVLQSACGVRLQGDSSREKPVKRFTFYARPIYGTGSDFPAPIFADRLSHSFSLRQKGNDSMAQSLTAGLGLGGQDTIPAAIFLNGEFYCEAYLRERYDARYFETHFGVDRDDLVVIADDELDTGTAEDYADYRALMELLQSGDCADADFYARLCERIDVENYAAFIASNLYLNNTDWSVYKNYRLWRCRAADGEGVRDGRWRWLVYDMDACYWTRPAFGDAPRASYDLFSYPAPVTGEPFLEMPVFRQLLQSPDFRELFVRTWLDLMNVSFSYDRALPLLEEYGLMDNAFWPEFLRERPRYALEILVKELELEAEACELALSVSDGAGGTIRLDRVTPDLSGGSWSGTYLTGVTVTLTAEPAEGWAFVGWRGDLESDQLSITVTLRDGSNAFTAVFAPQ